ncbi:MAG: tRNA (adenosine(37)-N6)-dimethylallyltransferase MiaA [Endomicrobiales bacterium]|nr:tRNA (adenosine(37)-N6)-dimethylallyltransferase MiaA [Endomicrobiales bacterium]
MIHSIIITGPTGSGKTEISCELAKLINGEIISADSRQVYKYLDVGTNKTGIWDKKLNLRVIDNIPQYLTDILEPSQVFSAGDFADLANKIIKKIKNNNKVPIIVGGTGLYIKALVDGLAPTPKSDPEIRKEVNSELDKYGIEHLYLKLKSVDPQSAQKNRNNPQRLIRALEVYRLAGTPISELHKKTKPSKEKFLQFGLSWNRKELYNNLDNRSKNMLASGMIEETEKVLKMHFSGDCPALQGIGYSYIVKYLKGEIKREIMEETFKRDIRRYAKRQITWFKKDRRISWINLDNSSYNPALTAKKIMKKLSNLV